MEHTRREFFARLAGLAAAGATGTLLAPAAEPKLGLMPDMEPLRVRLSNTTNGMDGEYVVKSPLHYNSRCAYVLGDHLCRYPCLPGEPTGPCDGSLATCRDKFNNAANFGGRPS